MDDTANKSAMKETVKRRVRPARRFCFLRRAMLYSPDGVLSHLRKNFELTDAADDAYLQWHISKFELVSLFQSAIGDLPFDRQPMVVSGNGIEWRLPNHWTKLVRLKKLKRFMI